jgi:hypothetical protein
MLHKDGKCHALDAWQTNFCCIAKLYAALQYVNRLGRSRTGTNVMREIRRPIHSGFESLRLRREHCHFEAHFNRSAFPANEQLTALGLAHASRSQPLFAAGCSR